MTRVYTILAMAVGLALAGCSSSTTGQDQTGSDRPMDQNYNEKQNYSDTNTSERSQYSGPTNADMQGQPKNNLGLGIAESDLRFMKDAHVGNLYEIAAGNRAVSKTNDVEIRGLAQHIIDDHTKADDQLTSLAAKKGISNLGSIDKEKNDLLAQLDKVNGSDFDREFLRQQRSAHEQTISEFQSAVNNIKDNDLKDWANKTLPSLQDHLNMVNARWNAIPGMTPATPSGSDVNNPSR